MDQVDHWSYGEVHLEAVRVKGCRYAGGSQMWIRYMPVGVIDFRCVTVQQCLARKVAVDGDSKGHTLLVGISSSYRAKKALASVLHGSQ